MHSVVGRCCSPRDCRRPERKNEHLVTFSDEANRGLATANVFSSRPVSYVRPDLGIPRSQKNFWELGSARCQLLGIRTRKRNRLLIRSKMDRVRSDHPITF